MCHKPHDDLLLARRALETISFARLLEDWIWDDMRKKWTLHVQLTQENISPNGRIPRTTEWFVLVDPIYPAGSIKFYPAKSNGIKETFPHQQFNEDGAANCAWSSGDLCLNSPTHQIGNFVFDEEPLKPDSRLAWHFKRAGEWLLSASKGELLKAGDDFELPQFPNASSSRDVLFYSESSHSLRRWGFVTERAGLAEINEIGKAASVIRFLDFKRVAISTSYLGSYLSGSGIRKNALWLLLKDVPVDSPWRAPRTWGELGAILEKQDIDLQTILRTSLKHFRDGNSHFLLLGFPLPKNVGGPPYLIHWQALRLPVLSHGKNFAPGFRNNELGYYKKDMMMQFFAERKNIEWIQSKNIDESQLSARGKLTDDVATRRFTVVGIGAIGSIMSELLVRSGAKQLLLVDGDDLEVGNLVRHVLSMKEIGSNKASSLATRLNEVSPQAKVTAIPRFFGSLTEEDTKLIQQTDVILDCTGRDDTLLAFGKFDWVHQKFFFSISVGFEAKRVFCFHSRGNTFPTRMIVELLQPWLSKERDLYSESDLPREGIGCWSLVFPARIEDIILLAAPCLKIIDRVVTKDEAEPNLEILEQQYSEAGEFLGIRRAS